MCIILWHLIGLKASRSRGYIIKFTSQRYCALTNCFECDQLWRFNSSSLTMISNASVGITNRTVDNTSNAFGIYPTNDALIYPMCFVQMSINLLHWNVLI
eukprot:742448_1